MGSSASVEHGAAVRPHPPTEQSRATPSPGVVHSPVSSILTDGRAGGGGGDTPSHTIARMRSRQSLAKKLVKGRVLFLGLDGAGKTTLVTQLQQLTASDDASTASDAAFVAPELSANESTRAPSPLNILQSASSRGDLLTADGARIPRLFPDPTKATSTSYYRLDGDKHVQLVDVPGRRMYRAAHWRAAFAGDAMASSSTGAAPPPGTGSSIPIVCVVFVVDATDHTRFPLVARELVAFQKLKDARSANGTPTPLAAWLQRAPFLMVLNKVDGAASDPNSAERRRASRVMRQLLKSAFDHQLRMDQKKFPRDYAAAAAAGEAPSHPPPAPASAGASPSHGAHATGAPSSSKKRAALAEVNRNRKTLLMTSLVECCAFDHDCVRAIQTLLRDDVQRLWSGAA